MEISKNEILITGGAATRGMPVCVERIFVERGAGFFKRYKFIF
jgi:hypothetical protein